MVGGLMFRSLAIISMSLALSACACAQSRNEKEAPKVKVILQAGSPVSVDEYTFYPSRLRVICRVMNRSDEQIVAVRLGWFAMSTNQETTTHFGEVYRIPSGLRPNGAIEVNALRVPDLQEPHIIRITMFIAEAQYSDGYTWRTDINSLRSELERRLRSVLLHREEVALTVPYGQK
jgi:hypothetical protein